MQDAYGDVCRESWEGFVILLAAHVSDDFAACRWEDRQAAWETCATGRRRVVAFDKTLAAPAVESASVYSLRENGQFLGVTGGGVRSEDRTGV